MGRGGGLQAIPEVSLKIRTLKQTRAEQAVETTQAMPDFLSNTSLMAGVFVAVTVFLLYIAIRVARNDPPTEMPEPDPENGEYSYDIPNGWDQETPLQLCAECGTFNDAEYQFCQDCVSYLTPGSVMPPCAIVKLKNEVEKQ